MRALGLITGTSTCSLPSTTSTVVGTLAYYSFEDKRITIRAKADRPFAATLVHELTHALQDQHFDIGDRMEALRKESKGTRHDEARCSTPHRGRRRARRGRYRAP